MRSFCFLQPDRLRPYLLPLLLVLCSWSGVLLAPARAQSIFGTLTGSVTDPSAALISGAEVTVTERRSQTARRAVAGSDGQYSVPNLDPGVYTVSATSSGFASSTTREIDLLARQTGRVDLQLEVASTQQQVEVTAVAPVITTDSPTISDTRTGREINELALNFRATSNTSPIVVATLAPGVQQDRAGNISINGSLPYMTQFSIDGVSTQLVRYGGPVRDLFPSVEGIAEFKVTASNNSAEYGQVTDLTTTSQAGNSDYHGSAYWFTQNRALNATNPFAPRDPANPNKRLKPALVANTFGGVASGPLMIPRFYENRNRTFFFFDYEGVRRASATTLSETVPPDAYRRGDLSSLLSGSKPVVITNPFTGLPFPNNQIPVNSSSAKILDLLYARQNQPTGGAIVPNFVTNVSTPYVQDGFDARLDHYLSGRQRVFARGTYKNLGNEGTDGSGSYNTQAGVYTNRTEVRNVAGSYNFVIGPMLINEFRAGYSLVYNTTGYPLAAQGGQIVQQLGFTGTPPTPTSGGLPNIIFTDGTFISTSPGRPHPQSNTAFQFNDAVTWLKGRHSAKFGYDFQRLHYQDQLSFFAGDEFGEYSFSGQILGNAFAEFLLGLPSYTTYAQNGPDVKPFAYHHAVYAQDEWRVSPRLTLNFGLRYELHPPFDDETKQLANFDRAYPGGRVVVQDQQGLKQVLPVFRQSIGSTPIVTAQEAHLPATLRNTDKNDFNPRFGFAYRPFSDGKTVIRGGIGIYTVTVLGSVLYSLAGVATSNAIVFPQAVTAQGPALLFPNVFPAASATAPPGIPDFRRANQMNLKDPYSTQWNLTIERDLGWHTGLRLSYTGSHTINLIYSPDLNQVRPNTLGYEAVKNTRPYPNFNAVLTRDNGPSAKYHAFTTEVTKRYTNGLQFQNSYTWARNLANTGGAAPTGFVAENGATTLNIFNIAADYGNVAFTRRHRFIGTAVWELPVGRNRHFFGAINRFGDAVVGGWQLSGITLFQTGPFLTPTFAGTDPSGTGVLVRGVTTTQRPDRAGNGNLSHPTAEAYFDRNAFARPANNIGRFGNAGVGILTGPGTANFSLATAKSFALTEKLRLRYEATFANLFNHVNLDTPGTLNIGSPNFGRIANTQQTDLAGPRTIQMSLRLLF